MTMRVPRRWRWAGPFFGLGSLVLAVCILKFAAPLFIPIGVAVLLLVLLTPVVHRLERWRVPRILAVGAAVATVIVAVIGLSWVVSYQANQLLDAFPRYESNLRKKLAVLRSQDGSVFRKLRDIARKVATRTVFMHEGRIWEEGTSEELFSHPRTPELRAFIAPNLK